MGIIDTSKYLSNYNYLFRVNYTSMTYEYNDFFHFLVIMMKINGFCFLLIITIVMQEYYKSFMQQNASHFAFN